MITILQGALHEKEFWLYGAKNQKINVDQTAVIRIYKNFRLE